MIKIEVDKQGKGIEMMLDAEGIEEMISFLNYIRENNESFHLAARNELAEGPPKISHATIAHAKMIYVTDLVEWDKE